MSSIFDIARERGRQVDQLGFDAAHDDGHGEGELARGAAAYLLAGVNADHEVALALWPWPVSWFKPRDYRRDLVRSAALIAAEIDRLDRIEARRLLPDRVFSVDGLIVVARDAGEAIAIARERVGAVLARPTVAELPSTAAEHAVNIERGE